MEKPPGWTRLRHRALECSGEVTSISARHDVTELLQAIGRGQAGADDTLLRRIYEELREIAGRQMAKTPAGQTLHPTALVHEAYVRLLGGGDPGWENRRHFFFTAARAMHDVLVEAARRKASMKHGGAMKRWDVDELVLAIEAPADDMLALDEALQRLEREDPRKHELVQLRFFAGLTAKEAAEVLDVSLRTVERDWRYIRGRLHKELSEPEG